MIQRPFGAAKVPVPIIGQGTWEMEKSRAASIKALQRGLDVGLTHIDTAEMYGAGEVEEIVGEAITGRRDEVFLVSKVLPSNATYAGTLSACERSLKRLRTDRLDCYLLHWHERASLKDVFRAFDRLHRDGKIRSFGVSNFDIADLEEAWAVDRRIACNQVLYHVKERAIEHAVLPWCRERGIAVVAYSPLGEGDFPHDSIVLRSIANGRGATPVQVTLAFLTRLTFAIPKASRLEHVEDNAKAGDLRLTDDDVRRIDEAFPRGPKKPLPMI